MSYSSGIPMDEVLGRLAKAAGLVPADLSLVRAVERPSGLGNHRGNEARGPVRYLEFKSLRLEGEARLQVQGRSADAADEAARKVQKKLLEDRDNLRTQGFLRLEMTDTSPPEHVGIRSWRETVTCSFLYEHRYQDDESAGLITEIGIEGRPEEGGAPVETTVGSSAFQRWDDRGAPPLQVKGPFRLGRVSFLASQPISTRGPVTLRRVANGGEAVVENPSLEDFLDQVTRLDDGHHAEVRFGTLATLLGQLETLAEPVVLGSAGEDGPKPRAHTVQALVLDPPLVLASSRDVFEISLDSDALERGADVYLKIHRAGRRT